MAGPGLTQQVLCHHGKEGECWVSDVRHPNYEAARAACKMVFGVEPQYTRLGKGDRDGVNNKLITLKIHD